MHPLDDKTFETQFANCTMDPGVFNHEAHIRLAWIHLRKYGREQAVHNICGQIARYDAVFGDGTKFHYTLTVAAIYIVDHHVTKSVATNFADFLEEYPRLRTHFREMIDAHYSAEQLLSEKAKSEYVAPDLMPFWSLSL